MESQFLSAQSCSKGLWPNLDKLSTKHPCGKGILNCESKGQNHLLKGENFEMIRVCVL